MVNKLGRKTRSKTSPQFTLKLAVSNPEFQQSLTLNSDDPEQKCRDTVTYSILNKMRSRTRSSTSDGERAIIERIRARATRSARGIPLGIGDDCALLSLKPGESAAVTTDLSIENRHFRHDLHPPEVIGYRTLARGLSDIAAMGARPVAAFLSLGLPPELTRSAHRKKPAWIDRFFDGFLALANRYQTPLAGGDLAQSSIALADILLVGAVPADKALRRSTARAGDLLYVTGALGGSAAGLRQLTESIPLHNPQRNPRFEPHLWPEPRIQQGLWLRRHRAATAAIDISDGLSTDLDHLCVESKVAAEIDRSSLPIRPGATLDDALHGGDDYELLFTARPDTRIPRVIAGIAVSPIGRITKSRSRQSRVVLVDASERHPLQPRGWEHFQGSRQHV